MTPAEGAQVLVLVETTGAPFRPRNWNCASLRCKGIQNAARAASGPVESGVEEGCQEVIFSRTVLEPGEDGPRKAAMVLRGPDGVVYLEQDKGKTEATLELCALPPAPHNGAQGLRSMEP